MYTSFSIKNFRGFKELELKQLQRVNLIAGKNNVGKTALLEAIFLLLGPSNPQIPIGSRWLPQDKDLESRWRWLFFGHRIGEKIEITGVDKHSKHRTLTLTLETPQEIASPAGLRPLNTTDLLHDLRIEYGDGYGQTGEVRFHVAEGNLSIRQLNSPPIQPGTFLDTATQYRNQDARLFSNLEQVGRQGELLPILQSLEPRLLRLALLLTGDGLFPGFYDEPFVVPTGSKFGKLINMYQEKTAGVKYAGTGKSMPGYATFVEPATSYEGQPLADEQEGYDLHLITYREISQTKSRTPGNYWLRALLPENFVLMNAQDAAGRGLADGDSVRISSPTNPDGIWDFGNGNTHPIVGKVKTTQGMRPGVIGFSLGFGHWAYGAMDIQIDNVTIAGDSRRVTGIHANAAMRTDPLITNTCLTDVVGGSAVFYDSKVRVEKV